MLMLLESPKGSILTVDEQSISSTRGATLLRSFLENVNKCHSWPTHFPNLSDTILSSCAFRSIHSETSLHATMEPYSQDSSSISPAPEVRSSKPLIGKAKSDLEGESLRMVEKRFRSLGKGKKTQEIFENVIRGSSRSQLGEIWLDGETVCVFGY